VCYSHEDKRSQPCCSAWVVNWRAGHSSTPSGLTTRLNELALFAINAAGRTEGRPLPFVCRRVECHCGVVHYCRGCRSISAMASFTSSDSSADDISAGQTVRYLHGVTLPPFAAVCAVASCYLGRQWRSGSLVPLQCTSCGSAYPEAQRHLTWGAYQSTIYWPHGHGQRSTGSRETRVVVM
jgi:hypothetical protein